MEKPGFSRLVENSARYQSGSIPKHRVNRWCYHAHTQNNRVVVVWKSNLALLIDFNYYVDIAITRRNWTQEAQSVKACVDKGIIFSRSESDERALVRLTRLDQNFTTKLQPSRPFALFELAACAPCFLQVAVQLLKYTVSWAIYCTSQSWSEPTP